MLRRCNNPARYQARGRRMPAADVRDRRWRGGGGRLGESDSDLDSANGEEADDRAPEDADDYQGDNSDGFANAHVDVLSVASDASDPPVQVLAALSEYDSAVLSADLNAHVPSVVSI